MKTTGKPSTTNGGSLATLGWVSDNFTDTNGAAVSMKRRKEMSVFDKHQLKIARRTLQLSDAGALILGGMTKDEARAVILRLTGRKAKED
jgi:hypothetical protein